MRKTNFGAVHEALTAAHRNANDWDTLVAAGYCGPEYEGAPYPRYPDWRPWDFASPPPQGDYETRYVSGPGGVFGHYEFRTRVRPDHTVEVNPP